MSSLFSVRCALVMALVFQLQTATANEWHMSTDRSRLDFVITYAGQETVGVFRRFTTNLQFDPVDLADSRLVVTVAVLSADMNSADINEAIAGPEWFDFTHFADAQFISDSIAVTDDMSTRFVATGRLLLKGVERVIEVPFAWSQEEGSAQLRGELTLQRGDFDIGSGEWAASDIIGQAVRVQFDIALVDVGFVQ